MKNRRIALTAFGLILTIGNYMRISGTENIRTIEFLSIWSIGAFSGLLIRDLITLFRKKE